VHEAFVLAVTVYNSHVCGMNFPKFWAKGTSGDFICWRWSFQSLVEAQSLAEQAARQLAERFRQGNYPPKGGGYYPDRPAREQILREISDGNVLSAVITRNSYGSQVLNTARVMFVDIDLPQPPGPKRTGGFFGIIFGKPKPPPPPDPKPENDALAQVEMWTANNFGWGWRVYRTRSGLRLLATQGTMEADSPKTDEIFQALGTDPLYRKLCKNQKCFRARLTPKPWRCDSGCGKPPRWPWTEREEKKFKKWEASYNEASADWATCAFVRQIGSAAAHPEVQPIIQLHDEATRVGSDLPLA
jgi:hypothetical protein